MPVEKRFRDAGGASQVLGGGLRVAFAGKQRQDSLNDGRFSLLRREPCFLQKALKLVGANLMSSAEVRMRKLRISYYLPFWSINGVTKSSHDAHFWAMSTVAEILEAVKRLPEDQKGEFLDRLREVDFEDAWERQMEADAKAGLLDDLWQQALTDIKAGRTKSLDEVIDGS
jgi:hypothetical protein